MVKKSVPAKVKADINAIVKEKSLTTKSDGAEIATENYGYTDTTFLKSSFAIALMSVKQ